MAGVCLNTVTAPEEQSSLDLAMDSLLLWCRHRPPVTHRVCLGEVSELRPPSPSIQ